MKIFLILFAIYITQILIGGAYPYYKYRKDCKKARTIGGFMNYMRDYDIGYFKFAIFFPYVGLIALVILCFSYYIIVSFVWVYERFIKDIKI